ncbi:M50 family metallopeptidase [Diplocloster modestus]|uniref:M50 family metallopeptidase n=1 Tax=Diplocloster modestus TaxID=2850322 RepID=A0ABS6K2S0_9FIRM|nr:M50 family metallopeptidase [Diplocloster modestus]MBU9724814.1 M50 family metallopeptidase [Diplocloster modestus]
MNSKVKTVSFLLLSAFIMVPLYIVLHEGGHALVALLCGAKITSFSILGAHVSSVGGVYTSFTSSLHYSAGLLLPVLVSVLYMLCYQKERAGVFYRLFSFLFMALPTFSILAWILVPLLYLNGRAPVGDDATQFLDASGLSPLLVILTALLLFLLNLILAWHKKIIQNYWLTITRKN